MAPFNLKQFINDLFTERDGTSWCLARVTAFLAFIPLVVQFIRLDSHDWQGFGLSVGALIAAVGFKNISEREK